MSNDQELEEAALPPRASVPVLLVTEERVAVAREVETTGAVRVRIESSTHTVQVPTSTILNEVVVERATRGVECAARKCSYYEGDVLVIPVYEEVPVVKTKLMLVEELRVFRKGRVRSAAQDVSVATDRAIVERLQPDGSWKNIEEV